MKLDRNDINLIVSDDGYEISVEAQLINEEKIKHDENEDSFEYNISKFVSPKTIGVIYAFLNEGGQFEDAGDKVELFIDLIDIRKEYRGTGLFRYLFIEAFINDIVNKYINKYGKDKLFISGEFKNLKFETIVDGVFSSMGIEIKKYETRQRIAKNRIKKIISEKENDIWYAYHATDKSNLKSIKENGLKPSNQNNHLHNNFIYLASNKDIANSYASIFDNPIILKIKLTSRDINSIFENNINYSFEDFKVEYFNDVIVENWNLNINEVEYFDDIDNILYNLIDENILSDNDVEIIENEIEEEYIQSAELLIDHTIPFDQIVDINYL
ncbi:MAG: hypothetical protein ACOCP8_05220 [archaeon]